MDDPTAVNLTPRGRKYWVIGLAAVVILGAALYAYCALVRYQTVYRVVLHGGDSGCFGHTVIYNDGQGRLLGRKETAVAMPWQSEPIALPRGEEATVRASVIGTGCNARLECFIRIDDKEVARELGGKSVSCSKRTGR